MAADVGLMWLLLTSADDAMDDVIDDISTAHRRVWACALFTSAWRQGQNSRRCMKARVLSYVGQILELRRSADDNAFMVAHVCKG